MSEYELKEEELPSIYQHSERYVVPRRRKKRVHIPRNTDDVKTLCAHGYTENNDLDVKTSETIPVGFYDECYHCRVILHNILEMKLYKWYVVRKDETPRSHRTLFNTLFHLE